LLINLLALQLSTKKEKKTKASSVVIEVSRSDRLKAISGGFRGKHCEKVNCFCCSIEPPSLSKNVIRSLGTDICKIKPGALSEEALQSKPAKRKVVKKISRAQSCLKNLKDDNTKKGIRSKVGAPDVSVLKMVVSCSKDLLAFSFYRSWSFQTVILLLVLVFWCNRISYAVTTIYVLGTIYFPINCYAAVLYDGFLVLLYYVDVFTDGNGSWSLMVSGIAQCFQGHVLIDDVYVAV
jgi:hypothetical protein